MPNLFNSQKKFFQQKGVSFIFIFTFITLAIISGFLFFKVKNNINYLSGNENSSQIVINGKAIKIELMDTYEKHVQGLSDKPELDYDTGYLFEFQDKQIRRFWMKNMNFPIDIIWIEDDRVVDITKNCPPEGEVPEKHYSPSTPVNYALEVNAGFSDNFKIQVGDLVNFKY